MAFKADSSTDELFKLALHSPQVLIPQENAEELISFEEIRSTIEEAINKCNQFRREEGQKLEKALVEAKEKIGTGLQKVSELDPKRIAGIKSRLEQSVAELKEKVKADPNRFEQELIYYIEKLDISEEKVRLQSHLDYFDDIIATEGQNGKKLGFLSQEIGREINTIGSKANDAEIQREVVAMKEELEKIKEQVLNVL